MTENPVTAFVLLEQFNRICGWQSDQHNHPLTCGVDSSHALLFPVMRGDKIILKCPTCGTTQGFIPPIVLGVKPN